MTQPSYDYIVVGAGAAGCVMARRLSEHPGNRVLLIEAGRDYLPGQEPQSIRDCFPSSYAEPNFFWPGLIAEVGADPGDGSARFSRPYQQARVMGGGSSIMGMLALRGLPADYDEWADAGATGWGWNDVLPFFCRVEHDRDFSGPLHGDAGPIPIRRHAPGEWPPFAAALGRVVAAQGYPMIADANGEWEDGLISLPMSNLPSGRISSAMAYLGADVRRRPNLEIRCNATVQRLLFEGTRCSGLRIRQHDGERVVLASETILCAGAIHSPTLLLRSGIGPADHLRGLGIEVVADRPGVGSNLLNHPAVYLATWLKRQARQPASQPGWCQNALRYSSGMTGCPKSDMLLFAFNKTGTHALGDATGTVNISVYKSFSQGSVCLRDAAPETMPQVRFGLLDDPRDRERLVSGVERALAMLVAPEVMALREECFIAAGPASARVSRPNRTGRMLSALLRPFLDHLSPLRRLALADMAIDPIALLADPEHLRDFALRKAFPMGHVSGTCRMGDETNRATVCDPQCRVIGTAGLYVSDASIMPTIPSGNTHLPSLMIAEKAADLANARRVGRS